ncbi:MAG: hypothetical protein AAFU78_18890 [Cyanobacteria bacterium J06633_2]
MPFISAEERDTYFPDKAGVDWQLIQSAMLRAEAIAQGPQGANRNLAVTEYSEHLKINSDGIARLRYHPLDLAASTPIVDIRGNYSIGDFGRSSPGTEWTTLEPTAYELDPISNEIRFKQIPFYSTITAPPVTTFGYSRRRTRRYPPMNVQDTVQARVQYSAGFDFSASTDPPEVVTLKTAIAGMTSIYLSPQAQGVESRSIDDVYKFSVKYGGGGISAIATSKNATSLVDEFLIIFRNFAPYETHR